MHISFEWICAHTLNCAHPREHTTMHTRIHMHTHTHTVPQVTHTHHTIVVDTVSEERHSVAQSLQPLQEM